MADPTPPPDTPRSRKVFWIKLLSAMTLCLLATFILYRVVAHRALSQRIQAVRDAGYPIDLAELDVWYEVPEGKNAADVYLRAFAAFPLNPDTQGVPVVSTIDGYDPDEPLSEEMAKRIEAYLALHTRTLALLEKAAEIEGSRYPGDLKKGLWLMLPYLGQLRRSARVLKLQSILDADRGEHDLAADRCITMIALARSLQDEPILISSLVSISIYAMTYKQVERLIVTGHLSDDSLLALTRTLEPIDMDRMTLRAMVGERSYGHGIFSDSDMLADTFPSGGGLKHLGIAAYRTAGLLDIDHSCYLDTMQSYINFVEHPTWPIPASLDDDDRVPRICMVTRQLVPALSSAYRASRNSEAKRRVVLTAIAAERYRQKNSQFPTQLQDLVPEFLDAVPQDPFDNQPLRYRMQDTGAIIYSIGADGTDDNGRELDDDGNSYQDGTDVTFTFGGLQEELWPGEGEQDDEQRE
jgi:hypothetical protein